MTIVDVARACGVTPATVSRVLNNQRRFSTSDVVRAKILNTARRVGYAPNLAARNLSRRSTKIVGVFGPAAMHVAGGIFEPLLEGLAQGLHGSGFEVFLALGPAQRPPFGSDFGELPSGLSLRVEDSRPEPQGGRLPAWRFDGAILLQAAELHIVAELDRRRVPYVCVNGRVPGDPSAGHRMGDPVACVLADDQIGMRRAVEQLSVLGHRRLAYANAEQAHAGHYSVAERHDTLVRRCAELSLELTPGHEQPFTSASSFLRSAVCDATRLSSPKSAATAVIAYDHHIGTALAGAAPELGLRIPHDFSLICFNDCFPVSVLNPALTVVAVPGRELGRRGADALLNVLRDPGCGGAIAAKEVRVPEDLLVRDSTAPPPATRPRSNPS